MFLILFRIVLCQNHLDLSPSFWVFENLIKNRFVVDYFTKYNMYRVVYSIYIDSIYTKLDTLYLVSDINVPYLYVKSKEILI